MWMSGVLTGEKGNQMGNETNPLRGAATYGMPAFLPTPNDVVDGDGFYVSFNCVDLSIYGCETTALVVGQMQAFYILNGDHRAAYAPLIPEGFEACMDYFMANIDQINARSDRPGDPAPRP